jgi:hypothetical protein
MSAFHQRLERLEEFVQRDSKRPGESPKRGYPNIPLSPLDAADIIAMQTGPGREFLLRHIQLGPQLAHTTPDGFRQVHPHAGIVGG